MLLLFIFIMLFLGALGFYFGDRQHDNDTTASGALSIILGIVLAIILTQIPAAHSRTQSDMQEFEAFRTTIQQQRADTLSSLERVTITQKIIEQNQWLAKEQYWAKSYWLDIFYDQDILTVKPIQ